MFRERKLFCDINPTCYKISHQKEICKRHKDVYYLDIPFAHGADYEGTVDNSHLTDLGYDRAIQAYQPKIAKILKKYGIKTQKIGY